MTILETVLINTTVDEMVREGYGLAGEHKLRRNMEECLRVNRNRSKLVSMNRYNITDWEEIKRTSRGILWRGVEADTLDIAYVVYIGKRRSPPKENDFDFRITKSGKRTIKETAWLYLAKRIEDESKARRGAEQLFKIHCE